MASPVELPPAPDPLDGVAETWDRTAVAAGAQMTRGHSPATIGQAVSDWAIHMACSPGKQLQLAAKVARKFARLNEYVLRSAGNADADPAIEPLPWDRRFVDPAWQQPPFSLFAQGFLLTQQWWHAATTGVRGVTRHHEEIMSFAVRQPMFVVGTEQDHVAPCRSVHNIHMLRSVEICFVLTSGAGIVSEPGHPHRSYRILTREADGVALDADEWRDRAPVKDDSWWEAWGAWLAAHSGPLGDRPPMGTPNGLYTLIADAPGHYVLEH